MTFKILLLPPDVDESWPEMIRQAVPGAIAKVNVIGTRPRHRVR